MYLEHAPVEKLCSTRRERERERVIRTKAAQKFSVAPELLSKVHQVIRILSSQNKMV